MSADFEKNLLAGVYRAHATTDRCRWTDMGNEMISSIKWKVIDFFLKILKRVTILLIIND